MEKQLYEYCLRCGRKLKNIEYKRVGMGKICQEKSKHGGTKHIFDIRRTYADNNNESDTV